MSQKTIEAVVEIVSFDGEPPWAVASIANLPFLIAVLRIERLVSKV